MNTKFYKLYAKFYKLSCKFLVNDLFTLYTKRKSIYMCICQYVLLALFVDKYNELNAHEQ